MTDDRAAIDQEDTRPETRPEAPPVSTREKRFEVIATFLLAFAALATAWTGYQASLSDGIQSSNYTQASAARTGPAQLRTEANQFRLADLSVFESFVDESVGGNDELAEFYRDRFRPEFEVAFDAWIALDPFEDPEAPPSPLAMSEYQLAADAEAATLDARADTLFREGEQANTDSDIYTMSTLLFAIVCSSRRSRSGSPTSGCACSCCRSRRSVSSPESPSRSASRSPPADPAAVQSGRLVGTSPNVGEATASG